MAGVNRLYRVDGILYRAEPDAPEKKRPCDACAFNGERECQNIWFADAIDCTGTGRVAVAIPATLCVPDSVEIVEVQSD